MKDFIFNIFISVSVGITTNYIYDKIKRHSSSAKRKSVLEFEVKFKFKK